MDVWRWDTAPHWWLVFAVDRVPVNSRELRNPTSLNRHAWWWGRSFELPPFTNEDGRCVLRLMHEHMESKQQTGGRTMALDWSDDDMARLEQIAATPGTVRLAAALQQTIEDALMPALHGGRVKAC